MAETIVSVITGELLSKVMSLTSNEVSLGWGVKNDVQELVGTLTTIKAVLLDAEEKQTQNEKLRVWLEKLKEVCYDVEDVLDETEVKDLCKQVMNGQSIPRKVLPESMQKLQVLGVLNCPELSSLPKDINYLIALRELKIEDCPKLTERCKPEAGEDWPKIAHIPKIQLDGKIIKSTEN